MTTDRSPAEAEIRRRIAARGSIPFQEFMELALYHAAGGYYTRPGATTGSSGDFSTSSDVSPDFGRRLAVQLGEVHARLGGGRWTLVEIGPGRGLMASDMLEGLAELAPAAHAALEALVLVEVSDALRALQATRLAGRAGEGTGIALRFAASLDELAPFEGAVVANELFDALPTHLLERNAAGDAIVEKHVTVDAQDALAWTDAPPSDPRLPAIATHYGLCARPGDQAEVCLALERQVDALVRVLARGAALVIDYGHRAAILADEAHAEGTLLGYHRHQVVRELLARPGQQDLTAHVNWDHLRDAAQAAGFGVEGPVRQDRCLIALGILDDLAFDPSDPAEAAPARAARRLAARSLILPGAGGGQRFEVVALTRGIAPGLRGLSSDPFPPPPF